MGMDASAMKRVHRKRWGGATHRVMMAALAAAVVASCAADPRTIQPAYVSSMKYDTATCAQIVREIYEVEPRLQANIVAQNHRRSEDAAGIILIGISPTMISPDNSREYEISRLKGESEALRAAGATKGCNMPPPPPPPAEYKPQATGARTR